MTDAELMRRIAAGDHSAFDIVYAKYARMVRHVSVRHCNNEAQCEDVTQQTFLRLWTKASEYDPSRASLMTWIGYITRNTARNYVRSEKAYNDRNRACSRHNRVEPSPPEAIETVERCRSMLDRVTTVNSQTLVLEFGHDASQIATAAAMGVSRITATGRWRDAHRSVAILSRPPRLLRTHSQ